MRRTEALVLEFLQVVVLEILTADLEGLLEVVIRVLLRTAGIASAGGNRADLSVRASYTGLSNTRTVAKEQHKWFRVRQVALQICLA